MESRIFDRVFGQHVKEQPIDRILVPFQETLKFLSSGGVLLLACAIGAMIWANSPWSDSYHATWNQVVTIGFGSFVLSKPLLLWINDGLMAVLFLLVGLEIKREVLVGELSQFRQAALPIAGALGGMVFPATIYFLLNPTGGESRGWGIPMATDIAFSLGILAMLGSRVPLSAKIFLTAFAIVDDIGASLVIALFYTEEISGTCLIIAGVLLFLMALCNILGVRRAIPYVVLGGFLWLAFLKSGVHPTVAGILAALTVPARIGIDTKDFLESSRTFLDQFQSQGDPGECVLTSNRQKGALQALETGAILAQTPLQRLEHLLHGWVAFLVMPVFALANAGVTLGSGAVDALTSTVSLGIIAGLIVGKQLGVTLFAWAAVRCGLADLPADLSWRHVYGLSWLGAIGFTMSLFIAGLAFSDEELVRSAKVGILAGSVVAGIGGWWILKNTPAPTESA